MQIRKSGHIPILLVLRRRAVLPMADCKNSPWRVSRDNTGSDERDQVHNGYDHCGDSEDLEERPEISRCWLVGGDIGVCFTNARCIFIQSCRGEEPIQSFCDKEPVISEPTYMRVSGSGQHGSYVL
jgi:hypothetical protein